MIKLVKLPRVVEYSVNPNPKQHLFPLSKRHTGKERYDPSEKKIVSQVWSMSAIVGIYILSEAAIWRT